VSKKPASDLTLEAALLVKDLLGEAAVGVGRARFQDRKSATGSAPVARVAAQAVRKTLLEANVTFVSEFDALRVVTSD
jgi:hypothetical protein